MFGIRVSFVVVAFSIGSWAGLELVVVDDHLVVDHDNVKMD